MSFRRYSLPFRQAVRTAHGVWARREGVLVRLSDGHGAAGLGEAAPIPWFGTETADEVAEACARLGARVSREQIEAVPERLGCLRFALASAAAECAAAGAAAAAGGGGDHGREERAAGGVHGREAGVSLGSGGGSGSSGGSGGMSGDGEAGGAGEGVPVAALLPAGRAALAVAGSRVEAGFRTFKWKVGVADARDELGLLDDLLAVLPAGARLRLDANGAWDRRAAERWLGRCAELPLVEFVEQPVAAAPLPPPLAAGGGGGGAGVGRGRAREVDLLLGLAGDFPVPLALDESVVGARDVARWLDAGWPGLFVLKPSLLGDVAGTLARLRAADGGAQGGGSGGGEGSGGGGRVVFSSALETVVGARAALGWALSWEAGQGRAGGVEKGARTKPARRAAGFGVWPLFEDARFDGPAAAPFARAEDVRRLDGEAAWNALR